MIFTFSQVIFAQSNSYDNDYYKNLLVANKAGFKSYDEYQDFLHRVDFEILYRSLNIGTETNYLQGDIIAAPSQRLSIVDVDTGDGGFIYLITGYGQNALSKCCMIISPYQLQHIDWHGEGLITEKLFLEFQGKSTYKQKYTIYECDVFLVLNPFSPAVDDISNRLNEAVKIQKKNFNDLLEELTAEEYQILLNNNFASAFTSESIQKMYYACSSQTIDTSNERSTIDYYDSWKTEVLYF